MRLLLISALLLHVALSAKSTPPRTTAPSKEEEDDSDNLVVTVAISLGAVVFLGVVVVTAVLIWNSGKNNAGPSKNADSLLPAVTRKKFVGSVAAQKEMMNFAQQREINKRLGKKNPGRRPLKQPQHMESGAITKENFKFLGPITIEAGQKEDVPLRHATDGQKSHSLKNTTFDDRLNICVDIGSDVENLEKDSFEDRELLVTDNDNTLVAASQILTRDDEKSATKSIKGKKGNRRRENNEKTPKKKPKNEKTSKRISLKNAPVASTRETFEKTQ